MTGSSGSSDRERRSAEAVERAAQLARRVEELKAGSTPTLEDVERARVAAEAAVEHARAALHRAADAHHRAADAHRRAAEHAETVGDPATAERHRAAAQDDDAAGAADEQEATSSSEG